MSLKKLFKVMHEDGIVLPRLNEYLVKLGDDEGRNHGLNSPSGVGTCLRSQYMVRTGVKRNGVIEPRTRRIFDNGTGVHERLQGYLKKEGILLLEETPVWNEEYQILGHCDGMLAISKSSIGILEIKSINANQFKALTEAKPEHRMQAQVYMLCLEHMRKRVDVSDKEYPKVRKEILAKYKALQESFIVGGRKFTKEEKIEMKMHEMEQALDILHKCIKPIDTMSLVYENKNDQDIKEFVVKWDNELVENILERYTYLNECVAKGEIPDRDENATSKSCSVCRYCNFTIDCWN